MVIYDSAGTPIIGVDVDNTSYRYREIMGDCRVLLEFSLTQFVELPVGSYIVFQGERYELMSVADVAIMHSRDYSYKVTFVGKQARFSKYRVHNPVDGRLEFEMMAQPQEHLAVIISNLNEREGSSVWSIGSCITGTEKLLSYNHTKLNDALTAIAQAFDTEWEVVGNEINLGKVEYNASSPLSLGYGGNNGFKPGVGRTNYGETGQIQRLFIQGGDRNISLSEYGNKTLVLPKSFTFQFDGAKFKYSYNGSTLTETGFDSDKAVTMVTDSNGYSVMLNGAPSACNEESLDLTGIYPKREGTVTDVKYVYNGGYYSWAEIDALSLSDDEWLKVQVDIVDNTIPQALDYSDCLLVNGEPLTVIFQTGMLAGWEFSATFIKAADSTRPANRFELVRNNYNGIEVPNSSYRPNASGSSDSYIVTNCYLPEAYICDKATFSGAEMDALREAAKFLYENKDIQLSFTGTIDDLYAKRNWDTIGNKIRLGGCVSFSHSSVQPTPLTTRIKAIKDFINNPYAPEVTLSNEAVKGGLSFRLSQLSGESATAKRMNAYAENYTRRSFRDAQQTMDMLAEAMLEGYTDRINPIAIQTMQMLVGDESLQFRYVDSKSNPQEVPRGISYSSANRTLTCTNAIIQHMTLGIDKMSNAHANSEYLFWDITGDTFGSQYFGDGLEDRSYYLYLKVDSANDGTSHDTGEYVLSQNAIAMNRDSGYYYLLVAIINSEIAGERSIAYLNGFTEILPGRITTDVIGSSDGTTYWDLVNKILQLGDKLRYDPVNGVVLNGTLVQTGSGALAPISAYCGNYDSNRTYRKGDEVSYVSNGETVTFRYKNDTASSGHTPVGDSQDQYWEIVAKGKEGTDGAYTTFVYKLASAQPSAPTTTSPDASSEGWSSTIPTEYPFVGEGDWTRSGNVFTSNAIGASANTWEKISFQTYSANEVVTVKITAHTSTSRSHYGYVCNLDSAYSTSSYLSRVRGNNVSDTVTITVPSAGSHYVYVGYVKGTGTGANGDNIVVEMTGPSDTKLWMSSAVITNGVAGTWNEPIQFQGKDGQDGNDGSTPYIQNGYWYINGSSTGVQAQGEDGSTPYIQNGYWYIDGISTGVKAQGEDGAPGTSANMPYQGIYASGATYVGSAQQTDWVYNPRTTRYYIAKTTAGNITNIEPGYTSGWESKWQVFGASFQDIAAQTMAAVTGTFQYATIQRLKTDSSVGNGFIEAEGNSLNMFDGSNPPNIRLSISGDDLASAGTNASGTVNTGGTLFSRSPTGGQMNAGYSEAISTTFGSGLGTITSSANSLSLPAFPVYVSFPTGTNMSVGDASGVAVISYTIDGIQASSVMAYIYNGMSQQSVTIPAYVGALSTGTHTLAIKVEVQVQAGGLVSSATSTISVGCNSNSLRWSLNYTNQKTEIGANGFRVMFTTSDMFQAIKTGNNIEFLIQSGNYGLRVTSSGVSIMRNGTWQTL